MARAAVTAGLLLLLLCGAAFAKHCVVGQAREATDDDFEDPNQLYTCAEDRRCCTEDAKPSCCGDMDEHEEIMRQVKLWGGVIGVIVLFGLLMWYARWDGQCCDEDTKCCGCCCRRKDKHRGNQRAQNMGAPPGIGGNMSKSDSSKDLLMHEQETYRR
ncbi:uncharacterized protein LOC122390357 [Amphibalanus amphitrite]|uniref:uncharacterized protein LOC122390357 n=1 Tax=Amphibalanus amphitrite TaxID=1232801 RepID=UPI001C92773B|nr:uncharacterized protein LOC122390357 [Amphibalanus amphitrite]